MKFRIRKQPLPSIPTVPAWVDIPPWRVSIEVPDGETGDSVLVIRRYRTHSQALAYALAHASSRKAVEPPC